MMEERIDRVIALRSSTSDGSSYQVFEDNELIGYVRLKRTMTCDKYLAAIHWEGEEVISGKDFNTPYDALDWIEKYRGESKLMTCMQGSEE